MPATLKNISKQPVTVILDHPAFLNSDSGWTRGTATFARAHADGSRQIVEQRRSLPGTLTLQPGQTSSELHSAIAKCSQVQRLIDTGLVALETVKETKKS